MASGGFPCFFFACSCLNNLLVGGLALYELGLDVINGCNDLIYPVKSHHGSCLDVFELVPELLQLSGGDISLRNTEDRLSGGDNGIVFIMDSS